MMAEEIYDIADVGEENEDIYDDGIADDTPTSSTASAPTTSLTKSSAVSPTVALKPVLSPSSGSSKIAALQAKLAENNLQNGLDGSKPKPKVQQNGITKPTPPAKPGTKPKYPVNSNPIADVNIADLRSRLKSVKLPKGTEAGQPNGNMSEKPPPQQSKALSPPSKVAKPVPTAPKAVPITPEPKTGKPVPAIQPELVTDHLLKKFTKVIFKTPITRPPAKPDSILLVLPTVDVVQLRDTVTTRKEKSTSVIKSWTDEEENEVAYDDGQAVEPAASPTPPPTSLPTRPPPTSLPTRPPPTSLPTRPPPTSSSRAAPPTVPENEAIYDEGEVVPELPSTPIPSKLNKENQKLPEPPSPAEIIEMLYDEGTAAAQSDPIPADNEQIYEDFDEGAGNKSGAPPLPASQAPKTTKELTKEQQKAAKQLEKEKEKLAKEAEKARQKEIKEGEKLVKKYKITEDELFSKHKVMAIMTNAGDSKQKLIKIMASESVYLLRKDVEAGKWLVKNNSDVVGLVLAKEMRDPEVNITGSSAPATVDDDDDDEQLYEAF